MRLYVASSRASNEGKWLESGAYGRQELAFEALYDPIEQPCFMARQLANAPVGSA